MLEELDPSYVLQHTITHNRGRGSGATVKWEGWNLWAARNGRLVRLEAYGSREEALEARERLSE